MRHLAMIPVLLAAVAGGCNSPQARSYDWQAVGRETYTQHSPQVVIGAPAAEAQQAALVEGQANGYDQPLPGWWLTRNDARLNVRSGQRGPTVESYVTWTYDRQQSYGGRVYDTYQRNTWMVRQGQTVR